MSELRISFGGPDRVSIRTALSFPNGLYISPHVVNLNPRLHEFLIKTNFAKGASAFGGDADSSVADFRKLTGGSLDDLTALEVFQIFDYYRQRLRNYGHVETLSQAEFREATVCNDRPCCPNKNGNTISVVDAMSKLKWFRSISHGRYGHQVFGRDWGFPPFHYTCQCRMEGVIDGGECLRVNKKTQLKWIFRKLW